MDLYLWVKFLWPLQLLSKWFYSNCLIELVLVISTPGSITSIWTISTSRWHYYRVRVAYIFKLKESCLIILLSHLLLLSQLDQFEFPLTELLFIVIWHCRCILITFIIFISFIWMQFIIELLVILIVSILFRVLLFIYFLNLFLYLLELTTKLVPTIVFIINIPLISHFFIIRSWTHKLDVISCLIRNPIISLILKKRIWYKIDWRFIFVSLVS